jgi:hypothetical protein
VIGMEANACYGCRFGSIKIDILAPEDIDQKKLVGETKKFTANIAEATKHKRIHYSVTTKPQKASNIDFNVNCTCILNVKKHDCSNFNHAHNLRIKHLNRHSKLPQLEVTQRFWKL